MASFLFRPHPVRVFRLLPVFLWLLGCSIVERELYFSNPDQTKAKEIEIVVPSKIQEESVSWLKGLNRRLDDVLRQEALAHFESASVVPEPSGRALPRLKVDRLSCDISNSDLAAKITADFSILGVQGQPDGPKTLTTESQGYPGSGWTKGTFIASGYVKETTNKALQDFVFATGAMMQEMAVAQLDSQASAGQTPGKSGAVAPAPQEAPAGSQPDSGTSSTNYRSRRYVALVIGIDRYQNVNRLQNAVADAQAVARALQSLYGFEIHELYDEEATRSGIYSAVREAVSSLREGDNLMIYYAGHGWEDPVLKEGYWVPVEGKEKDQSSFVSNGELKKFICAMEKAQHVLIVADSCFSGSFLRRALGERAIGIRPSNAGTTATEDFFRKMDNHKSRTVLTSGANEPVADGGREGHSVFGYYFLRSLTDPDEKVFTVSELVQRVQKAVASNSRQTPLTGNLEDAGHEDGQMVFCWKAKGAEPAGLPKNTQP